MTTLQPNFYKNNKGLSLVELMISLTIGLVIIAAAMSAYIGSSSASKMAEAQSRMNEDAQAALAILAQQITMAGNNAIQRNRIDHTDPLISSLRNPVYGTGTSYGVALSPHSIRGCDGNFANTSTAASISALTCSGTNATTTPDALAISYEADQFNTTPTSAGVPTDCLGNTLPNITATNLPVVTNSSPYTTGLQNATYRVAENRFYIGTSAAINNVPSLYCSGNGGTVTPNRQAQPLVENIEDLQLLYGATSSVDLTPTSTVAGYISASDVNGLTAYIPATILNNPWERVVSVRICIIVRSEEQIAPSAESAQYTDCDGDLVTTPPDLRLRRAFSTTVVLRNRVL